MVAVLLSQAQLAKPARLALLLSVLSCLWSAPAQAFSSPSAFYESSASGGGGGRWFTGSPADAYGCESCHANGPEQTPYPLYVTGLPEEGFAPAETRELVFSWPEFAARYAELRPDPSQPIPPDAPLPALGLTAELVAESGKGSGTLELRTADAGPDELCEMSRPNLKPRLGAKLYQVRAGVAPILLQPDENGVVRCEAQQLGQRCVVAMTSCGARQMRLVWTSPPHSEGAIWFSAGFVTTEAISGTPEQDSSFEVTYPIAARDGAAASYRETIRGVCSVAAPGADGSNKPGSLGWLWIVVMGLALRRRRLGRPFVLALLGLLSVTASCGGEEGPSGRPNPLAGLYAPGSPLGASDPTDVLRPGMGLGERCVAPGVSGGGTPRDGGAMGAEDGELTVEYQTQTLDGRYAPKNCSAVWIETPDGQFVATLEIAAALRRPGLIYMQQRTCIQEPGPDVLTSATMRDHEKAHSASWSGVDFLGNPMPDGPYVLSIEVTETDKDPGELNTFEFTKGGAFQMDAPVAVDSYLQSVSIGWNPEGGGGF